MFDRKTFALAAAAVVTTFGLTAAASASTSMSAPIAVPASQPLTVVPILLARAETEKRHGADDPAGDARHGRGKDDPAGDDKGGLRKAMSSSVQMRRGADDPAGDLRHGNGRDDPAGDDRGRGRGRGNDDGPNHH